ncbi:MAG: hypothetical protein ACK4NF_02680, partial [Planctomycetota bacterium]
MLKLGVKIKFYNYYFMQQQNFLFRRYLQQNICLYRVMMGLDSIENFISLFHTPSQLMKILRGKKFTENFFKKLLNVTQDREEFYNAILNYYIDLKIRKERAKKLFLKLIDDSWFLDNVIFIKGPVLSFQLYGNIDERLYVDIDVITDRKNLNIICK